LERGRVQKKINVEKIQTANALGVKRGGEKTPSNGTKKLGGKTFVLGGPCKKASRTVGGVVGPTGAKKGSPENTTDKKKGQRGTKTEV